MRRPSLSWLSVALLANCADPAPSRPVHALGPIVSSQALCDSAVVSAPPVATRLGSIKRLASYPMTAEVAYPIPPRGGYDPRTGEYWMIDASGPSVVAMDPKGAERSRWGRKGSGPGDLFMMPWYRPGSSVAVVGDRLLVFDMYRLSQFDRQGHFRDLVAVAGNPTALLPGASIVTLSDSTALLGVFQSRLSTDTSFASRTAIQFYRVHLAAPKLRFDTLPYFLDSKLVYGGGFNRTGGSFYNTFVFDMGETWTVSGGALFALSFSAFGVCQLDPASGRVLGAVRVGAERRRTTNAERVAVHEQLPGIDETNPDGSTFGEEMDAHWPATTPWYMHIGAGGHLVAASRSVSRTDDQVDLFDGLSYVGTLPVKRWWLRNVIGIAGDSLLRLERDTVTDDYSVTWYRLRHTP